MRRTRILIIGAGFSGICLGIHLKREGIPFSILEKRDGVGGTWRDNTYPGAACDSPAFAYCFSFEQKTDWSRKWAEQPEILGYIEHCAEKYGLRPHIRFGTEVEQARFDAERGLWRVRTRGGELHEAEVLVSSVGQLNRPAVPEIPGIDRFAGVQFHSARWNHDFDLGGKRVGVVGNAASAIQFVPQIAPQVEKLLVFQRSANWMLPKNDRLYGEDEKRRFAEHPWLARLYRWYLWASYEARWPLFKNTGFVARYVRRLAERNVTENVKDPALRQSQIPDYPVGGKRILIADDYYPTLERDNVELVLDGISHFTEGGVVTRDGVARTLDAVIFATGFQTSDFLVPMQIEGLEGRYLHQEWKDGAEAYLGLTVAGFPNFFMTYGPNTNLGHNSIVFMIECQTRYVMDCVRQLRTRGLAWMDLRRDAQDAYNEELQRELGRTVWARTDRSWYKNAAGRITNNWSGSTLRYWWETRRADLSKYELRPRRS